jgi:tRNA A-37 threonylcarbamoyl transferase component Bud32/tetratricopeptide (TPR) repeat protein
VLVGQTLGGRYNILELIATGGMGEVYRARDRELDELVALKVIRTDRSDEEMVERFRREVKLARRVTHANVARMFELGYVGDIIFCTMELIEGESLADRLARERKLGVAEAVDITCAICDALVAAHAAGVIHRDIKPANVLIGVGRRIVLADFGIAAALAGHAPDLSGTPVYMAPEQLRGEPATPVTDVYAAALVLYEMLTGQRAFAGTVQQLADTKQHARLVPSGSDISRELADVVTRATAAAPSDRTATAAALRRELAPWASADLASVQPAIRPSRPSTEERTLVVVAPRGEHEALHIATEVHEQLLAALHATTFRVLPRTTETATAAHVVARFDLGDGLSLTVTPSGGTPSTVKLPLAIDQIERATAIAAAAIHASIQPVLAEQQREALDCLLRARQISRVGVRATPEALDLVERANQLSPGDPRIQAFLAIMLGRRAFFTADYTGSVIKRAGEQMRAALAAAPDSAEAHLAAGHYELHTGDPAIAAGHYRVALACAPYLSDAHDHLGRLLVEAGYLDAAYARFQEAASIAPEFTFGQWEIARAKALEGDWDEHDRLLDVIDWMNRPIAKGRTAWWRNDVETMLLAREGLGNLFGANLMRDLFDVFLDKAPWSQVRDTLVSTALDDRSPSRRRKAFITQLVAEAAGFAGDRETCIRLLGRTNELGLFDLHWLDKVPTLASVRGTPELATIRTQIERRARAIYDALYGDHAVDATQLATT